jgi:hypothetical protein
MRRAQHAFDNPALDVAVNAGNELAKPGVVFFAPVLVEPKFIRCELASRGAMVSTHALGQKGFTCQYSGLE